MLEKLSPLKTNSFLFFYVCCEISNRDLVSFLAIVHVFYDCNPGEVRGLFCIPYIPLYIYILKLSAQITSILCM